MTIVEYNFKFAYTGITVRYSFDNMVTMTEFINLIVNRAIIEFSICNNLTVEIVEAGLNTNNYDSEMAPQLNPIDTSFKNFYINRTPNDLSFYIRVKTQNNNVIRNLQNMQQRNN